MKEVWICDPNYHKSLWTFALNFSNNIIIIIVIIIIDALRSYILNTSKNV